jgi:hypothetical protein
MIKKSIREIKGKAPFAAYSTEELAYLYGVTSPTILKWLEPFQEYIGEKRGWYYTIKQVEIIFDKIGHPER